MFGHKGNGLFSERQYDRGTPEFDRITSLSDAVFAIVMTLLVLTVGIPVAPAEQLAQELAASLPQIIVFILSFALVANIWWQHHRFIGMLGSLEPGLIAMNLVLLGMVVFVPFLTNLVGSYPGVRVAVLPFIGIFMCLTAMFLLMAVRARSVNAWRRPMTGWSFYWHVARSASGIIVLLIALMLALRWPVVGLVVLGVTIIFGPLAARRTYRE